jgi:hypothetical protein
LTGYGIIFETFWNMPMPAETSATAACNAVGARNALLLRVGIVLMASSIPTRLAAYVLALGSWGRLDMAAEAAIIWACGKTAFYVGLALAGPAALQRYPWLRPCSWIRAMRRRRREEQAPRP